MNYLQMLQQAREQRAALLPKYQAATTAEQLDALDLETRNFDSQITMLEPLAAAEGAQNPENRQNGDVPEVRGLNPIATYAVGQAAAGLQQQVAERGAEDIFNTIEYRQAFRDYVVSGTPIPAQYTEQRASEFTLVADVAAVIPTTILNKVIEDLTVEGKIFSRITQTSYQGGVNIPISNIKPEAVWLDATETPSPEQKAVMDAKIQFAYHVLEVRVTIGLLAATVSLAIFENTVVNQLKKAMIRGIEKAAASGTGDGQPKGFLKYNLPDEQKISFTANQVSTVAGWARAEAAIEEAYEAYSIYIMSKQTWEKYLNNMTSTTGQRIGLGKISETGQKILNGREVMTFDQLPGYDNAAEGEIFAVLINLEEYLINSNMAMYYKKWFDEDKNQWKHKALMIVDGQMCIGEVEVEGEKKLVGAKGLIYLTKA